MTRWLKILNHCYTDDMHRVYFTFNRYLQQYNLCTVLQTMFAFIQLLTNYDKFDRLDIFILLFFYKRINAI